MRLATHATSCDRDTRFTIFFMFATSSCTSSTMHGHCTCTQGRNCTPFVYVACRMSQKLNFLQLLRHVHCDSLRQVATARDRQFLVATVANRVSRRRKLYCESGLSGFTEGFLRCDTRCDRRETGKTPNRSHVAPHATAATGPSQAIAEVELGSTFAMRCDATSDLVYDFDLFYSKVVQICKSCL